MKYKGPEVQRRIPCRRYKTFYEEGGKPNYRRGRKRHVYVRVNVDPVHIMGSVDSPQLPRSSSGKGSIRFSPGRSSRSQSPS